MGAQWRCFNSIMMALWLCSKFYFDGALDAYSGRRFSRQEAVSRHAAVYMGWVLHTVARRQQDTQSQRARRVCLAGARACACRLRVRGRQMRWCVLGHGEKYVRVEGGEKVACNLQRAFQRSLKKMVSMMEMSSSCRSCA